MKAFYIDLSICNGCYCCQIGCKDEHVANDWTPYAKPQPDTGQFWIGIDEQVRGQVPKVKVTYIPKLCHHCDDAPCIEQCEFQAIIKREDGIVLIKPDEPPSPENCEPLPEECNDGRGQGFVTFVVKPEENLPTGTSISTWHKTSSLPNRKPDTWTAD